MPSDEKIMKVNGVEICVQTFGDPADPAILLVHGASASMLWWEQELCEQIAAGGRHVIRFDSRDTGRSVSYPPGQPGYSLRDMTEDAVGVLDALGIERAHVVGRSMGGAIVTLAAVHHADRVASLTLVTTSTGEPDLPPMSQEFTDYVGSGSPDPTDPAAVTDYLVGLMKVYSGGSPHFDETVVRALVAQDLVRTRNVASCLANHFLIDFGDAGGVRYEELAVPTLVVHGEWDPAFPLAHGQALQRRISGAELLVMEKTGHDVPKPLWDVFVPRLIQHTAG